MQPIIEKSWNIPNRLEDLTVVSRVVFEWLDTLPLSSRAKYAGRLAIEEIVSNTIKYGYDDAAEHQVAVHIFIDANFLYLTFEDDGHPFDPTARAPIDVENVLETHPAGGLGIELLQRMCSSMEYVRDGNINRLRLKVRKLEPDDTQYIELSSLDPL